MIYYVPNCNLNMEGLVGEIVEHVKLSLLQRARF